MSASIFATPYMPPDIKKNAPTVKDAKDLQALLQYIVGYYEKLEKRNPGRKDSYEYFRGLVDNRRFSQKSKLFEFILKSTDARELETQAKFYVMRNLQRMTSLMSGFLANMRMVADCTFQKMKALEPKMSERTEESYRKVYDILNMLDLLNPRLAYQILDNDGEFYGDKYSDPEMPLLGRYMLNYMIYIQGYGEEIVEQKTYLTEYDLEKLGTQVKEVTREKSIFQEHKALLGWMLHNPKYNEQTESLLRLFVKYIEDQQEREVISREKQEKEQESKDYALKIEQEKLAKATKEISDLERKSEYQQAEINRLQSSLKAPSIPVTGVTQENEKEMEREENERLLAQIISLRQEISNLKKQNAELMVALGDKLSQDFNLIEEFEDSESPAFSFPSSPENLTE